MSAAIALEPIEPCAHCDIGSDPRESMDYGEAEPCPACGLPVCPSCRAMSGPTVCGTWADGPENADEIRESEAFNPKARAARLAAYARATSPEVAGDQYELTGV